MKIPGVLYSDSSEYAKRSKHVVWWAAVERSTSVEQLALQVRELDLSIRWDDIENTHLNCKLDNESKKSIKLFKKVIIRRKAAQGMAVRYLLDFGRRRIPDVVARHGNMLEESSSERKKYWLDESYVPLHLIKAFEEKRISRKASKMRSDKRNSRKASMMNSNKVLDGAQVMKKPFQRRGLEYLFARAERVENYQCGHCMKDVPISEAVSCQDCCGFFHKRHVRKLSDGITATCTYVCHRCHADRHVKKATKAKLKKSQSWKSVKIGRKGKKAKLQKSQDGKRVNFDNGGRKANLRSSQDAQNVKLGKRGRKTKLKKGKRTSADRKLVQVESSKKVQVPVQLLHLEENTNSSSCVGLRRSARKPKPTMNVSALFDVLVDDEKGKRKKIGNGKSKKPAEDLSWQKKRTVLLGTFWKNGLQLSRKPNDERVMHFKRRKLFVPSELSTGVTEQPKCPLCCEGSYQSAFTYIACELCGGWFHGRAFGLHAKIVESLIGFRCHVCRKRNPPVCPCVEDVRSNRAAPLDEATNNAGIAVAREFPDAVPVETGYQQEKHGLDDARSGSLQESVRTLHKASSDDGQTPVSNLGLQVEVKCVPASEDAITGDIQIHDMEDGLRGNQQVESAENLKLEDNKIEPGGGHLTSLSEAGCRPCNSDGNTKGGEKSNFLVSAATCLKGLGWYRVGLAIFCICDVGCKYIRKARMIVTAIQDTLRQDDCNSLLVFLFSGELEEIWGGGGKLNPRSTQIEDLETSLALLDCVLRSSLPSIRMEALYMKLYEKYTRLKGKKDSEIDQVNRDQEVKFMNYTIAADNLIEQVKSENDRLKANIDDLRNEVASLRSAKDQQYADYEKRLLEERQSNQRLSVEIKKLQDLQREGLCYRSASDRNENPHLSTPLCIELVATEHQSNEPTRSRKRGKRSEQYKVAAGNQSVLRQGHHTREVSVDLSRETTSCVGLHLPECCRRNVNDGGLDKCLFHGLLESLIGMRVSILNESEGLCISAVHQSSGYSFSLTWVEKASMEEAELLYRVSTLGTFEKVAPEWMREVLLFSISMCPIFFERVSRVIKHY
ncbi:hypothetical protein Ancab_024644 [Ancistrocladus abbreviatus]